MDQKISSIIACVLVAVLATGCFPDSCGLFGGTHSYNSEFVVDRPFEPVTVAKGDTTILRPETYVHIKYTYTGGSNCDGSDYKDAPWRVRPTVLDDSVATAQEFVDTNSEPLWRTSERKVRIIGQEAGQTTLVLLFEYIVQSLEDQVHFREFEIELTVTESEPE